MILALPEWDGIYKVEILVHASSFYWSSVACHYATFSSVRAEHGVTVGSA
jgi:hypothetical protein